VTHSAERGGKRIKPRVLEYFFWAAVEEAVIGEEGVYWYYSHNTTTTGKQHYLVTLTSSSSSSSSSRWPGNNILWVRIIIIILIPWGMGKQHILATNIHRRRRHHHHHHHAFKHFGSAARSVLSTTIPGSVMYDPSSFVLQAFLGLSILWTCCIRTYEDIPIIQWQL
jgi:hypothetical protein